GRAGMQPRARMHWRIQLARENYAMKSAAQARPSWLPRAVPPDRDWLAGQFLRPRSQVRARRLPRVRLRVEARLATARLERDLRKLRARVRTGTTRQARDSRWRPRALPSCRVRPGAAGARAGA